MTIFVIILTMLLIGLVVLLLNIRPAIKSQCKIVLAGDISKVTNLTATINNLDNKSFVYNGEKIDMSKYDIFVVDGESMAKENIHTGNGLLVRRLYGEEKLNLSGTTTLLVFEIDQDRKRARNPQEDIQPISEYKLRKFIGYISNNNDLIKTLDRLSSQCDLDEGTKKNVMDKFYKAITFYDNSCPLIMSFTYPNDQLNFSFHHPKFLIGKVDYIIPKKVIQL